MQIRILKRQDWLAVEGGLPLDDGRVLAMAELLERAAETQGRFVRLGEDQYLVLSEAPRRRLDRLRGLLDQGRFHPLAAPAVEELVEGMEVSADAAWKKLLSRMAEAQALEPALPSTLQAELRDYQLEGFRWLARLAHWGAGACLADDMGLGKTVQALALILSRAKDGPTLVLAPTSVCGNWIDEAARFASTLRPRRFGPGDRAAMLAEAGPFDLVVASYGLLQTEGERLAQIQWQTVVDWSRPRTATPVSSASDCLPRSCGYAAPAATRGSHCPTASCRAPSSTHSASCSTSYGTTATRRSSSANSSTT
jgi:hypothetical protein